MIHTIRVKRSKGKDILGESVKAEALANNKMLLLKEVETARVYRLEGITKYQAKLLAEKLFCEDINQVYTIDLPILNHKSRVIEISYKPGVMNPEVSSILKASKDLGITLLACDSSLEYGFLGEIRKEELIDLATKLRLYNSIVEHVVLEEPKTLVIEGVVGPTATIPIRSMTSMQLMEASKDKLFLNLEEMKVIQSYFKKIKRDPTDLELETIAQTWSEHCAHKTFKAKLLVDGKRKQPLIKRIKKEALKHKKYIVSAFEDNSGVMEFYDGYSICGKAETHNSPSAIEPYGGAMTGSGGVFRDVVGTGQGAKTVVSTDIFCFAYPTLSLSKIPSGCLPPSYLLKRCVYAVRDYGNRMGIPTNNGSFHFHNDFRAKPTVLVGGYGILPTRFAKKGKPRVSDVVVAIGGRTGRDGIHGATFSSGEMTDRTISVNSSAVQIGNAIEEKRMFDAIIEARNKGLIRAITDCGAGGFSSAIGEMGSETGVSIQLKHAKLKYEGLSPWEIWISESQERMVLAIPKTKLKTFLAVCKKYNVEASILGIFDGSGKLSVYYGKKLVSDLDMEFLHNGLVQRKMIAKRPDIKQVEEKLPLLPKSNKEWVKLLQNVLQNENISSKEPIVRLYDHTVQGTNTLQPFSGALMDGPQDGAVIRPLLSKPYGMIVSHGLNPILNRVDPYKGSIWAAAEAISNYTSVGGNYKEASLINNYIWPFPDEESLWSLNSSVEGVLDFMKALKIPVISGKDSLSSTYRGKDGTLIKIPPVLCMSVFGRILDVSKTSSSDFKNENSTICLVGKMDFLSMGGSIYYQLLENEAGKVPAIDLKVLPKTLKAVYRGIRSGKVLSCHDVSEGGLITSVFEMCIGGNLGATLNISRLSKREDFSLFNETAGCFIVEVKNEKIAKQIFKNVPFKIIGKTISEFKLSVFNSEELFNVSLSLLKKQWQKPMKEFFN